MKILFSENSILIICPNLKVGAALIIIDGGKCGKTDTPYSVAAISCKIKTKLKICFDVLFQVKRKPPC